PPFRLPVRRSARGLNRGRIEHRNGHKNSTSASQWARGPTVRTNSREMMKALWFGAPFHIEAVLGKQPQSAPSPLPYAVGACMTRSAQASAATCITSPVEGTLPPAAMMRAICSRHTTFCCSQENARSSALFVTLERESEKLFWSENVPRERSTKTISTPL